MFSPECPCEDSGGVSNHSIWKYLISLEWISPTSKCFSVCGLFVKTHLNLRPWKWVRAFMESYWFVLSEEQTFKWLVDSWDLFWAWNHPGDASHLYYWFTHNFTESSISNIFFMKQIADSGTLLTGAVLCLGESQVPSCVAMTRQHVLMLCFLFRLISKSP